MGGLGPGGLDSWDERSVLLGVLNHGDPNPPIYHDLFQQILPKNHQPTRFCIQSYDRVHGEKVPHCWLEDLTTKK